MCKINFFCAKNNAQIGGFAAVKSLKKNFFFQKKLKNSFQLIGLLDLQNGVRNFF